MILNLGSYINPMSGAINVDILKWMGVDRIVDLEKLPWPWSDQSFDRVYAIDIVEHLAKLTKVEIFRELARIMKPHGLATVRVPCATHPWALASLQHAHSFMYNSLEESYAQPWFKCENIRVRFSDSDRDYTFNVLTRKLCKLGFVFTITFRLRKL